MFEKLPSLRGFDPQWFTGAIARFHLPLVYDLVALTRPRTVVTLGFGDGQIHFAFCQAARDAGLTTHCFALRRDASEDATNDEAWSRGAELTKESFPETSELISQPWADLAPRLGDRAIDILFVDEIDSGAELSALLAQVEPAMAQNGTVLFHGTALERADPPGAVWEQWATGRRAARFAAGLGLGLVSLGKTEREWLFQDGLGEIHRLAAEMIAAQQRARAAERAVASLEARQVWLETILEDRRKAQRHADDLGRRAEAWQRDRESLQRDRAQAQLVMEGQLEQLKHWTATAHRYQAEREKYKEQAREQKELLKLARKACRKKGRCFQVPGALEEKKPLSLSQKILREIKRVPRNLLREKRSDPPKITSRKSTAAHTALPTEQERYAAWIAEHEPNEAGLAEQRRENAAWPDPPKISLLLPVYNPPAGLLNELIASVLAQTYPNWELCLVVAGPENAEIAAMLERLGSDARGKIARLPGNLGIAENTNRALALATGDFFACIDQDDLLAPFALHEVARAIIAFPQADVIYSDEDRSSVAGERSSPFFKPEWNPGLLCSFMYLGHLTAYRRGLAAEVGGFRKEFDFSQDYDFALRATERAREIRHIAQVLYHWREHPASGSMGGKPDARRSNLAALAEAMRRRNLPAEIVEYPSANRARLVVTRWPRVSIIVSTDSPERGRACALELPQKTDYPDLEVIVVTNSGLAQKLESAAPPNESTLRVVRYDQPFNFSGKCNAGAAIATGERLIFFNDDVVPTEPGWIQELIEQLESPEIGAVAPKMLYENGRIQHAGLVTGVRGLVGTACHQWPADSSDYTNFAQSLRDVSALSAACLAMRREDFFRVGQFDPINTPIAHSDLDLCFKVRAAGLRCVYTPFVTMTHLGHASIGPVEAGQKTNPAGKASVFLLKRWAGFTCDDPFFPKNMRDWLYRDSPTPIRMWGENAAAAASLSQRGLDLLFVTHDLSWSGAPLILWHTAQWCRAHGFFVVLLSPENGPVQEKFSAAGIPVIVDPLVNQRHPSFAELAREFDGVVASTIFGAPIILSAKAAGIPHLWWIHEGQVAQPYLEQDPAKRDALRAANLIVCPDTASARLYQPFTERTVRILNYGIPDPRLTIAPGRPRENGKVRFLLLGTIERRKGQRVFLEALRQLPEEIRSAGEFQIVGRAHDRAIADEIEAATRQFPELALQASLTHEEALAAIQDCDVMVSASWDETGPLILMEALALGKPILSTKVGAVAECLTNEEGALFFAPGDAAALAAEIARCLREPGLLEALRKKSRPAYEKFFTFERFAEGFASLIREGVAAQKTGPR